MPKSNKTILHIFKQKTININKMLIHRVARCVLSLKNQKQGTDLPCVPQTTKFNLTQPLHDVNNTIQNPNGTPQTKSIDTQYSRLDTTYALKKLMSTRRQHSWLPSTPLHAMSLKRKLRV